jgi:hypothetical protein
MTKRLVVLMLLVHLAAASSGAQMFGVINGPGPMLAHRHSHTATLLRDGRVLIVGGDWISSAQRDRAERAVSAELYIPSRRAFAATGNLTTPRAFHNATLLTDGRVLITGGQHDPPLYQSISTAELYDPRTGTFTATPPMVAARVYHAAVLLGTGKVLIVSGAPYRGKDIGIDLRAELFDPASGTFAATGTPVSVNPPTGDDYVQPTTTLLKDGRVLVTWTSGLAELYDPGTGQFTATGSMITSREYEAGSQTLLANGAVLVAGGSSFGAMDKAEVYDPSSGTFRQTGKMTTPRARHTATLFHDGRVLLTGGNSAGWDAIASMELYDPATGAFASSDSLSTPRYWHTSTLLDDATVLLSGGIVGVRSTSATAELSAVGVAARLPLAPH